jgi:hypothetical protein
VIQYLRDKEFEFNLGEEIEERAARGELVVFDMDQPGQGQTDMGDTILIIQECDVVPGVFKEGPERILRP